MHLIKWKIKKWKKCGHKEIYHMKQPRGKVCKHKPLLTVSNYLFYPYKTVDEDLIKCYLSNVNLF